MSGFQSTVSILPSIQLDSVAPISMTEWSVTIILSQATFDGLHMPTRRFKKSEDVLALRIPAVAAFVVSVLFLSGCAVDRCAPGRPQVDSQLQVRVNKNLGPSRCSNETLIPGDVQLDDGTTADEAVAVALWNNSAFNATLARLGMARGDLVQAGLLKNPQFSILLPGGTKQLEWTLFLPVDALLLRKTRLDMSEREVCRVAEELVQNGLDLVRDTRVAHADLVFATDRSLLANEAVDVRKNIADLTRKQLEAGDISELEATTARIDLLRAQADAAGLAQAVTQAEARLKQLMGIGTWPISLHPIATDVLGRTTNYELETLIAEATNSRPDLRAACFAAESAKKRAELSRWQWLKFDAVADANSGGVGNNNFGPGFRFDLPIFDRNQGGIQTADWSVYQATQNYNAVRDQVVMDVQTALSQTRQASDNLTILRSDVLSSLQEAVDLAGKAYADGGAAYFLVLQTTSQFLDSRAQELQLVADLTKAHANLDRSVGRNLMPINPGEVAIPMDVSEDDLIPLWDEDDSKTAELDIGDSHPVVTSQESSSLFSDNATDTEIAMKLRDIADQFDANSIDSIPASDNLTTPVSFGGFMTMGWQN